MRGSLNLSYQILKKNKFRIICGRRRRPTGPSFRFLSPTEISAPETCCPYETKVGQEADELPIIHNKRQTPRYSLKGSILRKRPVLKLSATEPLDCVNTPYKWWCRVCKFEFSHTILGVLELMAHYRFVSHLIREHRIWMETPGKALYDKDECEIQVLALKCAKNVAEETYPTTRTLPLVGWFRYPPPILDR